jgi:hypothetical protein
MVEDLQRQLSSYDEIWEADADGNSRRIQRPIPDGTGSPPVAEERASGSGDLTRLVAATVAKVLKEQQRAAAVPATNIKKRAHPSHAEQF